MATNENLSKSMVIDGIAASEAIDTSGEILDVAGADISDLESGVSVLNYEHRNDKDAGASANDIIGAITYAKKIFDEDDAETPREKMYWEKIKLPFVYIKAELFNDEGHPGAIAAAALIRYYNRRKLPILARFSIEGSTIEREGNTLKHTLARRVALTIKPANRSCYSGVLADSTEEEVSHDSLKELARHEDPLYQTIGSYSNEIDIVDDDPIALAKEALENLKEYNELSKAISAGGYNAAPTSLTGGSALAAEEFTGTVKTYKNQVLSAVRDFKGKKGKFRDFLKMRLPDVSDAFIDHFSNLVNDFHVKKAEELHSLLNKSFVPPIVNLSNSVEGFMQGLKAIPKENKTARFLHISRHMNHAPFLQALNAHPQGAQVHQQLMGVLNSNANAGIRGSTGVVATVKMELEKAEEILENLFKANNEPKKVYNDEGEELEADDAKVLTQRGIELKPNPAVKYPMFDTKKGLLHTNLGTLKLNNPDNDDFSASGQEDMFRPVARSSSEEFRRLLKDPKRVAFHNEATRNWLRVHKMMQAGQTPPELAMHAMLFSMLSPNTPVPVQELMYAHLVDAMKERGVDARDPAFGKLKRLWMSKDSPSDLPKTAHDYFAKEIPSLITLMNPNEKGRQAGDLVQYQLAGSKFKNMAKYHGFHQGLMDIVAKHKANSLDAVQELLAHKKAFQAGDKSALPVAGLAPKTALYAYSMMGGGNSFVPDTHFVRHLFGLDPRVDKGTIDYAKKLLWNPNNLSMIGEMNKWYDNHPAMQYMLNHPEFKREFKGNEENARFPAFWMHWLAIADHEKYRGIPNRARQEQTTHAPYWEATSPFTKSEEGDVALNNAVLHHQWVQQYGEIPAQMMYFKYIVPQLLRQSEPMAKTENELSLKAANLEKAAQDIVNSSLPPLPETTPPAGSRKFKGRNVIPGEIELLSGPYQGTKLPLLGQDKYQFYAGGEGDLPSSLPYHMVGKAFKVNSYFQPVKMPAYVDGTKNSSVWNQSPEQLALIHGIDMARKPERERNALDSNTERNRPGEAGWTKPISGKDVYIKPNAQLEREYPYEKELPFAARETIYYNLAKDYFGLGQHVMPTATFNHPETNEVWSAMERVPNGEHFMLSNSNHRAILNQLASDGRLDKLALMDYLMGSRDRRRTNYMLTEGGPQLYHVDNGLTLNYGKAYHPDYLDDYRQSAGLRTHMDLNPIHPAAIQWLNTLNPNVFAQHLANNGVPGELSQQAIQRLQTAQAMVNSGRSNWGQVWNSNYYGED